MPRKMSGSAISMMEELTVAISMPSVVLDSAIHLYRDPAPAAVSLVRGWDETDGTGAPPEKTGPDVARSAARACQPLEAVIRPRSAPRQFSCYMTTKLCRDVFPPARQLHGRGNHA